MSGRLYELFAAISACKLDSTRKYSIWEVMILRRKAYAPESSRTPRGELDRLKHDATGLTLQLGVDAVGRAQCTAGFRCEVQVCFILKCVVQCSKCLGQAKPLSVTKNILTKESAPWSHMWVNTAQITAIPCVCDYFLFLLHDLVHPICFATAVAQFLCRTD